MRKLFALLWRIMTRNKKVKLISIILGLVAWYAIKSTISTPATVADVPVRVVAGDGWAVLERSLDTVDVLFRGATEDLRYLDNERLEVVVDVSRQPFEGSVTIALEPSMIKVSGGARAISFDPPEITLSLDSEAEKIVPVKAELTGDLPDGYEIEKVVCTPAVVHLSGPRLRLEDIETAHAGPVALADRVRSFTLRVPVIFDSDLWQPKADPSKINVEITLVERSDHRVLDDVPVGILVEPGRYRGVRVEPLTVKLAIRGRSDVLAKFKTADARVFVNASGLEPGRDARLPLQVQLPPGLFVDSLEPADALLKF